MLNENRMLFYFICDKLSLNCLESIYDENRKGDKVKIWKEKRITANELRNDIIKSNDLLLDNISDKTNYSYKIKSIPIFWFTAINWIFIKKLININKIK